MRIFYFNVTYGCNSNCIFCYSHNTWHNSKPHNEMPANQFFDYLEANCLCASDRVIVNGGEPLLHTEIDTILVNLIKYGCEVLVYTNGRLLSNHDFSALNNRFRFVIPIHGIETVHDSITGIIGSYKETVMGLRHLVSQTKCLVDVKLILNNELIQADPTGLSMIAAFNNEIEFNNAIHLTRMADTIISIQNGCKSVSNEDAACYMNIFFSYFKSRLVIVKLFDTCIKNISLLAEQEVGKYSEPIEVFFKDKNQCRKMDLTRIQSECMQSCPFRDKCMSAAEEYKVLEYFNDNFYEGLE